MAAGQVDGGNLVAHAAESIGINLLYSQIYIIAVDVDVNTVGYLDNAALAPVFRQHDLLIVDDLIKIYGIYCILVGHFLVLPGIVGSDVHKHFLHACAGSLEGEVGLQGVHAAVVGDGVAYGHQRLVAVLEVYRCIAGMEGDISVYARFLDQLVMDECDVFEGGVGQVFTLVPTHQIGLAGIYLIRIFKGKVQMSGSRIECCVVGIKLADSGVLQRRILDFPALHVEWQGDHIPTPVLVERPAA